MKNIVIVVLALLSIWLLLVVGAAYEEHILCLNGVNDYCIEADFQQ